MFFVSLKKNGQAGSGESSKSSLQYIDAYYATKAPHQPHLWKDDSAELYALGPDAKILENRSYVFILNGYFLNFEELTKDLPIEVKTEIDLLSYLYVNQGLESLKKLRGSFSIAIYHRLEKNIVILSDFYGFKPTFYTETPNYFLFCSRHQPLFVHKEFNKELHEETISEYFSVGLNLENKTFFKHLKMSAENSKVFTSNNEVREETFGFLNSAIDLRDASLKEAADEIYKRIKFSCRYLIDRFGIKNMYLTGGSDSRILISCLEESQRQNLTFITFKAPSWSPDDWDTALATQLAKHYRLTHDIQEFDDYKKKLPMGAQALFPRRSPFPILTASFGTEFLGQGVFNFLPVRYSGFRYDKYHRSRKRYFNSDFLKKNHCPYSIISSGIENTKSSCKEFGYLSRYFWRSYFSFTYAPYGTPAYISPYEIQYKNLFSPFLTQESLDGIQGLPREYLINYRIYEQIFTTHLSEIKHIPLNSSMTKFARGVIPVQKNTEAFATTNFDYKKVLKESADSPAFQIGLFRNDFYDHIFMADWYDLYVKAVDFLYWHKICVERNYDF